MQFKKDYLFTFEKMKDDERHYELKSLLTGASVGLAPALERSLAEVRKGIRRGQAEAAQVVADSNRRAALSIVKELGYLEQQLGGQMQQLTTSVHGAAAQISGSIEQAARYLGAELSHISFQLSLQTQIGQETLRILKESLDNESRQYFEQGIAAFEQDEIEIARERFQRALEANSTNAVAYQYLGFIAVEDEDPDAALRNFDLSRKFAPDDRNRALAWYHLANCRRALGALDEARACMDAAVELRDGEAWLWYERAKICALQGKAADCDASLEKAFWRDWLFYAKSALEPGFDMVSGAAEAARARSKQKALDRLDKDLGEMEALTQRLAELPTGEPAHVDAAAALRTLRDARDTDNLYEFLDAIRGVPQLTRLVLEAAQRALAERVKGAEGDLATLAGLRDLARRQSEKALDEARKEHDEMLAADDKRIKGSGADVLDWVYGILFGALGIAFIFLMFLLWTSSEDGAGDKILGTIFALIGAVIAGAVILFGGGFFSMAAGGVLAFFRRHRGWRGKQDELLAEKQRELNDRQKVKDDDFARRIRKAEPGVAALQKDLAAVEKELEALPK